MATKKPTPVVATALEVVSRDDLMVEIRAQAARLKPMPADMMLPGKEIPFGRFKLIMPALSLKQVRQMTPLLSTIASSANGATPDDLGPMCDVIHAALVRNYPDILRADLDDMVDLNNIRDIWPALNGLSGLVPSGEVVPVSQ